MPNDDDNELLCGRVIEESALNYFRPMFHLSTCIFTQNATLPQVFFKAGKNQLPGFYISGTLVKNALNYFLPGSLPKVMTM